MSLDAASICATLTDTIDELAVQLRAARDWPLIAPPPDAALINEVRRAREAFCAHLGTCTAAEAATILRSALFEVGEAPVHTGLIHDRPEVARQRIAAAHDIMGKGWTHPMAIHAFLIAALHVSPHEMPLMQDLHTCPDVVVERYLAWLFRRPNFRHMGDDARYVTWVAGMLDWLRAQILDERQSARLPLMLNQVLQRLDIGMIIYSDVSIRPVLDARAALVETVTAQANVLRGSRVAGLGPRARGRKIRLGFLIRTIMRHPDPLAFCAQFEHFDRERYEIILYSHDKVDRQCEHDIGLYQRIFAIATAIHSLHGLTVREMIDRVCEDDLDIFVYSYAATIGVTPTDCMVSARLARIQVVMNSHVPLATGLPSFTHVATVAPPAESRASVISECREALAEIPRVLLSYPPVRRDVPERVITRRTLGIPEHVPVFYNGGAADKIVPVLAQAWIRALARTPQSRLVLAPFNPGWIGVRGAIMLSGLFDALCAQEGVDRNRVIVLRELSPRDTQQILDFTTVYLGTFPHGSSTSVALALQACVPVATRRSPWLRGTGDASIVSSIGLHELIAPDADAYVDLTVRLASDHAWNASVRTAIGAALPGAAFLNGTEYGQGLQHMFDMLAHEAFGYPVPRSVSEAA